MRQRVCNDCSLLSPHANFSSFFVHPLEPCLTVINKAAAHKKPISFGNFANIFHFGIVYIKLATLTWVEPTMYHVTSNFRKHTQFLSSIGT